MASKDATNFPLLTKKHGHGGMQYFSLVFTTKWLNDLDGIHYTPSM